MSTHAYLSELRIECAGCLPETRYGFYVSGTSYSDNEEPFASSNERQDFLNRIAEVLEGFNIDDDFTVAALACLAVYGNDELSESRHFGLQSYLEDYEGEDENGVKGTAVYDCVCYAAMQFQEAACR